MSADVSNFSDGAIVAVSNDGLLAEVADYYSQKLSEHGATPQGVDWNGRESQDIRFRELCRCIDFDKPFSVNDLGCGYGALVDYLEKIACDYIYHGFDVALPMIERARQIHGGNKRASFAVGSCPGKEADYSVASGIFNVRQERPDDEWLQFILDTLDILNTSSRVAFAFNCLTAYSDEDKKRQYLYYADPCFIFDHCKRRFGRRVSLLHDYELYEFTVIVRKNP